MKKKNFGLVFFLLASAGVWAAAVPPHPEFSANSTTYSGGQITTHGKFFLGKNAARMEMQIGKQQTYNVYRFDRGVVWQRMDDKNYMELSLPAATMVGMSPTSGENCSGEEMVGGRPTQKCEAQGRLLWKATQKDLMGAVLKNCDKSMKNCLELTEVRLGSQPENLFSEPQGKKMEMGGKGLLKGLMGGRP